MDQVNSSAIAEIDGRLAQPNADGGSLADWSEAEVKVLETGKDQKKFHFTVPVGETDQEEHEIVVRFVEGKGWRLDVDVETIR